MSKKRLWVIEAKFRDGSVDICDFTDNSFAFTNFYDAHIIKREIYKYLHGITKRWEKSDIFVTEYIHH